MKYLRAFGFFLSTLLLYLGLPLFGWGFDNLRGFFSLAPRLGYALSVVLFADAVGAQAFFGRIAGRGFPPRACKPGLLDLGSNGSG